MNWNASNALDAAHNLCAACVSIGQFVNARK